MHGGPLEEIRVEGDALRFRVEAGDADMTFSGQLRQGKLTGILEATANGRRVASGSEGPQGGRGNLGHGPGRAAQQCVRSHRTPGLNCVNP